MGTRKTLGINGRAPLLCALTGGKLNISYVRGLLPRLARKAGIEKRVHAHGLRHNHAADLVREGVPAEARRLTRSEAHRRPGDIIHWTA